MSKAYSAAKIKNFDCLMILNVIIRMISQRKGKHYKIRRLKTFKSGKILVLKGDVLKIPSEQKFGETEIQDAKTNIIL